MRICRPLRGLCLFFAALCLRGFAKWNSSFAVQKQLGPYFIRQKEGMVVSSSAGDFDSVVQGNGTLGRHIPTGKEKELASLLKHAGNSKKGPKEWRKLYANYSGHSPLVLTAAMHAALKQRDYQEGYQVYKRVRHMTLPTYSVSIQLLGKLGQQDELKRL